MDDLSLRIMNRLSNWYFLMLYLINLLTIHQLTSSNYHLIVPRLLNVVIFGRTIVNDSISTIVSSRTRFTPIKSADPLAN